MRLPGCNRCGQCGCVCGKLPYTLTVTFSGLPNKTDSPHCGLTFSSNFGCGAAGVCLAPGGYDPDDKGPLLSVLLTEQGHDYAKLGRVAPTVTIKGRGTGATFTPTLTTDTSSGCTAWAIESVEVAGGTDYTDGESLVVTVADGDTTETNAVLTLTAVDGVPASVSVENGGMYWRDDPDEPPCLAEVTVTADCGGGEGAVITATIGDDPEDRTTWGRITALTIDDGGDDYLCWTPICSGASALNDIPFVVVAQNPEKLVTLDVTSCYGSGACVRVVPKSPDITCDEYPFSRPAAFTGEPGPIREIELVSQGSGYARLGREQPDWTVEQHGLTFTPAFGDEEADACGLPYWPVESFTVSGTPDCDTPASFVVEPAPESPEMHDKTARATVTVPAGAPSVDVQIGYSVGVDATWERAGSAWKLVSLSVPPGTTLETDGASVSFSAYGCTTEITAAAATVNVNDDGEVTGFTITNRGAYRRPTPDLDDITVSVTRAGRYYRENPALEPYVASPVVNVVQLPPSDGSGAEISVEIQTDTEADDFGQCIAANLENGGGNYTLLGGPLDCSWSGSPCPGVYISVSLRGAGQRPRVTLSSPTSTAVFETTEPLGNCDELPTSATLLLGIDEGSGSASIERGGAVQTFCGLPVWCIGPPGCPTECNDDVGITVPGGASGCGGGGSPVWSSSSVETDGSITKARSATLECIESNVWLATCQNYFVPNTPSGLPICYAYWYAIVHTDANCNPTGPINWILDFIRDDTADGAPNLGQSPCDTPPGSLV